MIPFPEPQNVGEIFSAAGKSWQWNGVAWLAYSPGSGGGGGGGVTSYNDLTDKPTLGTAAATASTDYATAAQGAKADSALQAAALTPYRTAAAQDTIDAGKADVLHDHDARYYTESEIDTLLAEKQPAISTLPLDKGGTGATTAEQARINLGISNGVTSYNDLTDKPTLGTAAATASSDYATAAQGAKADSALQSGAAISSISGLQTALDGKQTAGSYAPATGISPTSITGTAVVDSDSRLSNSRQPTSHKSTHATGGTDVLTPADIGAVANGGGASTISVMTEAAYTALPTKDNNTIYILI